MKRTLLALSVITMIAGCASGVSRQPNKSDLVTATTTQTAKVSKSNPLTSATITLSKGAADKQAENLKFNKDMLLDHVKRALEANQLLLTDYKKPNLSLEVLVKDMRVRSNFSAIMFGFMAGNDSITGDIIIRDPKGQEIDRFEVSASYALGGIAGGVDDARMGWLYENFALETVNEIKSGK